jgi:hypothetical protein
MHAYIKAYLKIIEIMNFDRNNSANFTLRFIHSLELFRRVEK